MCPPESEVPASTTSLSGMPVDAPMSVTLGLAWVCLSASVRRSVLISVPVAVLRCCTRGPWPRPRRLSAGSPTPRERDVGERISVAPAHKTLPGVMSP
jgi:hypothetical protein